MSDYYEIRDCTKVRQDVRKQYNRAMVLLRSEGDTWGTEAHAQRDHIEPAIYEAARKSYIAKRAPVVIWHRYVNLKKLPF